MQTIKIWTDGSCKGNCRDKSCPGGWAYLIKIPSLNDILQSGGESLTTNNRMELQAVIQALLEVPNIPNYTQYSISIFTDSEYVQKGITEWIYGWIKNNWKTSSKKPVLNQDLWKILLKITQNLPNQPSFIWTKGHDDDVNNQIVDNHAQKAVP